MAYFNCPDCGVKIGELHLDGCDVERCPDCGGKLLSCGCTDLKHPRIPWSGKHVGENECEEYGWFLVRNKYGHWVPCVPGTPGSVHDLNRLYEDARWDADKARWIKK